MLDLKGCYEYKWYLYIEDLRITDDIRKAVEKIYQVRAEIALMHTKSIQEKAERCGEEIDWETSFQMVHGQNKFQSFITSMADSHHRSHRVKALLGLLPTAEVLHRRLPDTYKFEKCPVCRSDNEHMITYGNALEQRR